MVDLGRKLFFDRRLSFNATLSCGMCHVPEQGFTQNELATPVGFGGLSVKRNAPALYNVAYRTRLFHDGREGELELQIWSPLLASNEMANPSIGSVLERIAQMPEYANAFTRRVWWTAQRRHRGARAGCVRTHAGLGGFARSIAGTSGATTRR